MILLTMKEKQDKYNKLKLRCINCNTKWRYNI